MSIQLLEKLEEKIDHAIEVIEFQRLQIEELEEKNTILQADNTALKGRQTHFEQGLGTLLRKLEGAHLNNTLSESDKIEHFEREATEAV